MKIRTENNVTVVSSEEGKDLYNNFLECNAGKECWLGYVYYKNGKLLETPYLMEPKDFTEIDEEKKNENNPTTEIPETEPSTTSTPKTKTKKSKK